MGLSFRVRNDLATASGVLTNIGHINAWLKAHAFSLTAVAGAI